MKITIAGNAGVGKTTIATLIAKALKDEGIKNVTVVDEELVPFFYEADRQKSRLGRIAMNDTPVTIECVQMARNLVS